MNDLILVGDVILIVDVSNYEDGDILVDQTFTNVHLGEVALPCYLILNIPFEATYLIRCHRWSMKMD